MKSVLPNAAALTMGILARFWVSPVGPHQEHWDNPIYWQVAYPAICLGCVILGYPFPRRAWYYGLAAVAIQGLWQILSDFDAELIALSIVLLIAVSVPPTLAGLLGSRLKSRSHSRIE